MTKQEMIIRKRQTVRALEDFYTNGVVENLDSIINEKKSKIINSLIEYAKNNEKPIYNKDGKIIDYKVAYNPVSINNMFFKPLTGTTCFVPKYNAEKLAIVFDYYNYLIQNVNEKIGTFPSSISSFCKLANISTSTLRSYKNSADEKMREVVQMIYDQIGDDNITLGQLGRVKSPITIYKMNTQNEMVEKKNPNVNIHLSKVIDEDDINKKLDRYKTLLIEEDIERSE